MLIRIDRRIQRRSGNNSNENKGYWTAKFRIRI